MLLLKVLSPFVISLSLCREKFSGDGIRSKRGVASYGSQNNTLMPCRNAKSIEKMGSNCKC